MKIMKNLVICAGKARQVSKNGYRESGLFAEFVS